MPGVTVIAKGTAIGVSTDAGGKYSIAVPTNATTLVFSFIGMKSQEVAIEGRSVINVIMEADVVGLNEVVLTAPGISREKKSLGYATQEVKGDVISTVKTANFMNNLSGKVSGVQIQKNQNMGGSTNVIVRGSKSLVNSNQVLYVVDGVPSMVMAISRLLQAEQHQVALQQVIRSMILWSDGCKQPKTHRSAPHSMESRYGAGIRLTPGHPGTSNRNPMSFLNTALSLSSKLRQLT